MSAGNANTICSDIAISPHTKMGMRLRSIPGARSLRIVTMKLMAPPVVEMPRKISPTV